MGMADGKVLPRPSGVLKLKMDIGNIDLVPFRVFTEVLVVLATL